jgi:8-oxo-dGTP pyrophosphatase MutT (NUDIX family)
MLNRMSNNDFDAHDWRLPRGDQPGPRPHAHVVVRTDADELVLIRRVRSGRVFYVAAGVAVDREETLGAAAIRAADEELGVTVEIDQILFALTFAGAEHTFFAARLIGERRLDVTRHPHDDFALMSGAGGTIDIVTIPSRLMLAYDIRPRELAITVGRNLNLPPSARRARSQGAPG